MARPLYKSATLEPTALSLGGNAGLWFDKFCNKWLNRDSTWSMSTEQAGTNPKLDWIGTLTHREIGERLHLDGFATRVIRLVEGRDGRAVVFKAESRFVTGLGRAHPVENGFAWHPTLGTPYLPGSSIKGMVRSWAQDEIQSDSALQSRLDRIFGKPGQAGAVCFLDAIPIDPVRLEADVMTPHFAGWSESDPPGDWCSPTPIPFLVTSAGMKLLFGVVPCVATHEGDLAVVIDWLDSALAWAGAGAKTAVGYGRMVRDDDATNRLWNAIRHEREERERQRREEERRESLDPLEAQLEDLAKHASGRPQYRVWLEFVEQGRWRDEPEAQRRVLEIVKREMESSKKWKPRSEKKRPEKDGDHQETLLVMRLLAGTSNR